MSSRPNRAVHHTPSYVKSPVRMAWRLLRHPNKAARAAVLQTAMGYALDPLDRILSSTERRLRAKAGQPQLPVILVCGPPRSGTTLVAQYLINCLDVGYINNLSTLMPRAPLTGNRLFGLSHTSRPGNYNAFYGKSTGLSGANDGLPIWDEWLSSERDLPLSGLSESADPGIANFFAALQQQSGLPTVNKVNRLVYGASQVAAVVPNMYFVVLHRNPLMLAQSLLVARDLLTGSRHVRYGQHDGTEVHPDPIEDVARQVEFLQRAGQEEVHQIGPERAVLLNYEDFCIRPEILLSQVREVWNLDIALRDGAETTRRFRVRDRQTLPDADYELLRKRINKAPEAEPA